MWVWLTAVIVGRVDALEHRRAIAKRATIPVASSPRPPRRRYQRGVLGWGCRWVGQ